MKSETHGIPIAQPIEDGIGVCEECGKEIKRVPGGDGMVSVHVDTEMRFCKPRTYTEAEVRAALQHAAVIADDSGDSAEVSALCDTFCQRLFGDAPALDDDGHAAEAPEPGDQRDDTVKVTIAFDVPEGLTDKEAAQSTLGSLVEQLADGEPIIVTCHRADGSTRILSEFVAAQVVEP